jgi:hypothetical protein
MIRPTTFYHSFDHRRLKSFKLNVRIKIDKY